MAGIEEQISKLIKALAKEVNLGNKRAEQFWNRIVVDHNDLANLQGGQADQYFHLTQAEHALLGTGITDHGELDGLGDDDHPHYFNAARHTKAIHDALNIDADTLDSINSGSFLRSDIDDNLTAAIVVPTDNRDEGIFGTYVSTKTQHIWSMGTGYRNSPTGVSFGNLYGLAYKYNGSAGGHGVYLVNNGAEKSALGLNVWTSGVFITTKVTGTAPFTVASTTKVTNLNVDRVDGYHVSTTPAGASSIPVRDANGYLYLGWINTVSGGAGTVSRIYCSQDAFIRYLSPASLCSQLRTSNEVMREVWHTTITNLAGGMAESLTYIDLDLTAYSSANAKGVICNVTFQRNVLNNAHNNNGVCFRKNGSTVAYHAKVQMTCDNRSGATKTWMQSAQVRIPCDAGQIIEWLVFPATSVLIDEFYVVGYWE